MTAIGKLDKLHHDLCRLVLEKHHHNNMSSHRHIPIETWLEAIGMMDYHSCFSQYSGVEEILHLQESEIRDLGVKNSAHRSKLVSTLRMLQEKYEKSVTGRKVGGLPLQRNQNVTAQLSWSPPSLANSPDYQVVNVSPDKLQHDLLVELQGDPSDLKSKAWYHGNVSRQRAESVILKNGDFLVRDCISRPGDFVLTCRWKGGPLHFVINSTVTDQGEFRLPKVTYHFEEIHFNSVQELIQFYMDECKQITEITGAVITTPIGRTMPLSYYDSKYGSLTAQSAMGHYGNLQTTNTVTARGYTSPQGVSPRVSPKSSPQLTPKGSPRNSPSIARRNFSERSGSQPLLSLNDGPVSIPMDRADSLPIMNSLMNQFMPPGVPPGSLPVDSGIYKQVTPTTCAYASHPSTPLQAPHQFIHQRSGSAPTITPGLTVTQHFDLLAPPTHIGPASSDSDLHKPPPPKPSRIPSVKYKKKPQVVIRNIALYDDDSRDYSDYGQVKEDPSWLASQSTNQHQGHPIHDISMQRVNQSNSLLNHDVNQNIPKDSRKASDTRYSVLDGHDYSDIPAFPIELNLERNQSFITQNSEPKTTIKVPSLERGPSFNLKTYISGLLPNENRLLEPSALIKIRHTLLECCSKELAKYLTCVDLTMLKVLTTEDLGVRVTSGLELITLPQGTQLRQDILERIYCMRAFVMVMILTCDKVIDRAAMLSQWIQIAMETKGTLGNLFGFVNIMEGLMSDQILRLRDTWMVLRQNHTNSAFLFDTKLKSSFRKLHDGSGSLPIQDITIPAIAPVVQLLEMTGPNGLPLEELADMNNNLDITLTHLDMARLVTDNCADYRETGLSVTSDLVQDDEKSEMFGTEFHMRFLWGYKGSGVTRAERQNKFDMLLTAYSEKIEREGDDGTAV